MIAMKTLNILLSEAEQRLKEATVKLGEKQQAVCRSTFRLDELRGYYQEYIVGLQATCSSVGIQSEIMHSRQCFINQLSDVMIIQQAQVERALQEAENEMQHWKQVKSRFIAFEQLRIRAECQKMIRDKRQDQKEMDAFAQHIVRRRAHDAYQLTK